MAVQTLFYLAFTGVAFGLLFLCTAKNATTLSLCTNNYKLVIAGSVFSVVTDFLVLGIPIMRVWHLRLSVRRKIGVTSIFMTGSM